MQLVWNYLPPRRFDAETSRRRQNLPRNATQGLRLVADNDLAAGAKVVAYQLPG